MKKSIFLIVFIFSKTINGLNAGDNGWIPPVYSNIAYDESGELYFEFDGKKYPADKSPLRYDMERYFIAAKGSDEGIELDFGDFSGRVVYGLIPYGKSNHPQPVFRFSHELEGGKTSINISRDFRYPYDFVDWQQKGHLTIGYRLIDEKGMMIYDGEISVQGSGPFEVVPSIFEGPFVSNIDESSVTIWFKTTGPIDSKLLIDGRTFASENMLQHHEYKVDGLEASKTYAYTVVYGNLEQSYSVRTAAEEGSRKPFVFAYSSDSRHGRGGGERGIFGTNAYIMKKMAALAFEKDAAFMQFTGDMINGYLTSIPEQQLQYTNWKKALEIFWHYMPVYAGMGNHEAFGYKFPDKKGRWMAFADGFPYEKFSAEKIFADAFVNPMNGPSSEDDSKYDPRPDIDGDFPSYQENVYYYSYGNVAMIVLNSDYWFTPTLKRRTDSSGNLHGYIMDEQLKWLEQTLAKLEKDRDIDHIFVTQHTPAFPNGGHSGDDMWYGGNNDPRPYIAGKAVQKGIIERRDEYLDLLINGSSKVVAILTGDEHNYNRMKLTAEVPIYPENWPHKRLNVSRPIFQINNGAAGAPYYGQEILPWSEHCKAFSVENALCLFYVDGNSITLKVINPDTLGELDGLVLKK